MHLNFISYSLAEGDFGCLYFLDMASRKARNTPDLWNRMSQYQVQETSSPVLGQCTQVTL